jgi:hypothetical protein
MSSEEFDPYGDESITKWHRLSPTARNETMQEGLKAKVADPLWFVGRQWQVGELAGEDAGSPIKVECWYEHDPLTRLDRAPESDAATARDYDVTADGPLETAVEREPIRTGDGRNREDAVEAGRNFLSRLDREGVEVDGRPVRGADFDDALLLDDDAEPVDAGGERFLTVADGRALDGHALYDRVTASGDLASESDWENVSWGDVDHAYPGSGSPPDGYRRALKGFVDYHADLYDEPDGETAAWNADRMEYEFAVATGTGDDETAFFADEYGGGRLDWDAFSIDPDRSLAPDSGTAEDQTDRQAPSGTGTDIALPGDYYSPTEELGVDRDPDLRMVPTKVSFPGMPSARWWELEDGNVNLDRMEVGPGEVGKLLLAEFATLYGNDWFAFDIDVPVGSLTRIEHLTVTDTFGQVEVVDPAVTGDATTAEETEASEEADEGSFGGALSSSGGWNVFTHPDLPNHDEPGLFFPPVLGAHHESDPVERVLFARDEMANMAFGIELVTEDAIGDPLNWREFTPATLAVDVVQVAETAAGERVRFVNPGEATIDVGGWTVESDTGDSYQFPTDSPDTTLDSGEHLTLYTGPGNDAEPGALFWGETSPVWNASRQLTIRTDDGTVVRTTTVGDPANPDLPDYRLVSDVEDYWFPLRMQSASQSATFDIGDLRFELARLLDADSAVPSPRGRILVTDLSLHDEELTRAGLEVTRTYQYARWIGGSTYCWSGRDAGLGRGEGRSGLRFDYLDLPDPDEADGRRTESG